MGYYRFDKTTFTKMTLKEAEEANLFGKDVSYAERLRQATYLIYQAYGFSSSNLPKLDRKIHSSRKMSD
ncbi:hypothetical protein [Chitinophaga barathri]|uniref:Uncharacterized protein n=1 Tax=Chitinophaga barathri TaxID=1647451 RepID=A0A3N4MCM9_9BACT|nr:hypothetical protein [Chitinophaga barathri]RPD39666.1 hypothetical protein EG028_18650 [Chitinophaga barathri]